MKNSIIQDIDKQMQFREGDLSQSGLLRELFDEHGAEWNDSDIDTKLEALKILITEKDENILKLIIGMMTTYNEDRDSNHITPIMLVETLSKLLEVELKRKSS